jgi:hypothetical protein
MGRKKMQTNKVIALLLPGFVVILALAGVAHAGPTNTPLPTFSGGSPAVHVYTAVGVIKNNNMETAFICTNVHTAPAHIGIEVFDAAGTLGNSVNAGNGALLNVAVGQTVTFATSGTALLSQDQILTGVPNLRNGSGRVVATTKNVSCTAMVLDELHAVEDPLLSPEAPPTVINLPLVRVP